MQIFEKEDVLIFLKGGLTGLLMFFGASIFLNNYSHASEAPKSLIEANKIDSKVSVLPKSPEPIKIEIAGTLQTVFIPEEYQATGIKEVIAVGSSSFADSAPSRIKNIRTAVAKFDGTLIHQGEIFSFNEILESVNRRHGYVRDLVVQGGRNVWEMGGGVCQLSTSIFRAALNAGLPIPAAKNHSVAIPYYKPYGLDAAVYMPNLDLQFVNDTPGDILMHVWMIEEELVVVLYGTKDSREVVLDGPYLNKRLADPEQAHGLDPSDISEKRLDYRSFQVQWVRSIKHKGEKKEKLFTSWYRRGIF